MLARDNGVTGMSGDLFLGWAYRRKDEIFNGFFKLYLEAYKFHKIY